MSRAFCINLDCSYFLNACRYFKFFSLDFLVLSSVKHHKVKLQLAQSKNFKTPSIAKRYFVICYNAFLQICFILLSVVKNFFQYSRIVCNFISHQYVLPTFHIPSLSSVRFYELLLLCLKKSFRIAMLCDTLQFMLIKFKIYMLSKQYFTNFIYKISSLYLALLKIFFECLYAMHGSTSCQYILPICYGLLSSNERLHASQNFRLVTPFAFLAVINTIKSDTSIFTLDVFKNYTSKFKVPSLANCFVILQLFVNLNLQKRS